MAKKIIMFNSSPRKKNTYNLLLSIGEILEKNGMEYEIIDLYDYNISCCTGCDVNCIHNNLCLTSKRTGDDMPLLMQKIMDSDGVVFSSPVYLCGVTAKFKLFADRTNIWVHNPAPAGRVVLNVATTASTGLKETKQFLKSFAIGMGARLGGFIGRTNPNMANPVSQKEIGKFIKLLKNDKKKYRPKLKELIMFQVQKVLAIKFGAKNKAYWEDNKLLDKYYFYDCKISFIKKVFSKTMFRILNKAIKI